MAETGEPKIPATAEEAAVEEERVVVDLPAPAGWQKNFTPKKGGTLKRNEISFISPTGEQIRNKSQLERYLRKNPGGPELSEFDWGTGDSPRRSARISHTEKAKAQQTPEQEKPAKRLKKTSLKKTLEGKKGDDLDSGATADVGNNGSVDREMKEADEGDKEAKAKGTSELCANESIVVNVNKAASEGAITGISDEQNSDNRLKGTENENLEKDFGQQQESKPEFGKGQEEVSAEKEKADGNMHPENFIQKDSEDKSIFRGSTLCNP